MAALPLLAICLTGAVLVFEKEMTRTEQQVSLPSDNGVRALEGAEVIERLEAAKLQPYHLGFPKLADQTFGAYAMDVSSSAPKQVRVFVNPYTGEITKEGDKFFWSSFIVRIHRNLAAGKGGQLVVAISSCVLAVTSLIGVILWWPLRKSGSLQRLKRWRARDWHNLIGVIALIPLFVMSVTGVTFTWGKYVFPIMEKIDGRPLTAVVPQFDRPEGKEKSPSGEALSKAAAEHPGSSVSGLQPSRGRDAPHSIIFEKNGEPFTTWYDPYTLEKLGQTGPNVDGLFAWYHRNFGNLHTFHAMTLGVRTLWGLLSLSGAALIVTGLLMSLMRWKKIRRPRVEKSPSS